MPIKYTPHKGGKTIEINSSTTVSDFFQGLKDSKVVPIYQHLGLMPQTFEAPGQREQLEQICIASRGCENGDLQLKIHNLNSEANEPAIWYSIPRAKDERTSIGSTFRGAKPETKILDYVGQILLYEKIRIPEAQWQAHLHRKDPVRDSVIEDYAVAIFKNAQGEQVEENDVVEMIRDRLHEDDLTVYITNNEFDAIIEKVEEINVTHQAYLRRERETERREQIQSQQQRRRQEPRQRERQLLHC